MSEVVTRIVPKAYNGYMMQGDEPWVDSPLIEKYPTVHYGTMTFEDVKMRTDASEDDEATGGATGDQTGKEIYVRNYYNYPWNYVLRLPGGGGAVEPEGVYIVRWIPG